MIQESTSPCLYDSLFLASTHSVKVFFFSFEDKLFDRVIGTPFRRGKPFMGNFFPRFGASIKRGFTFGKLRYHVNRGSSCERKWFLLVSSLFFPELLKGFEMSSLARRKTDHSTCKSLPKSSELWNVRTLISLPDKVDKNFPRLNSEIKFYEGFAPYIISLPYCIF